MYHRFSLKFIVSRWANFYFFVDNFSEHVEYARKRYNQAFLVRLGPLKQKERTALVQYCGLVKTLEAHKTYQIFNATFYQQRINQAQIWKSLERILAEKERQVLKRIFMVWENRFSKTWRRHYPILKHNRFVLNEYCKKNHSVLREAFKRLKAFYGVESIPAQAEVYLIMMPLTVYTQGGRKIVHTKISLETGLLNPHPPHLENVLLLILHEFTHAFFETEEYKQQLNDFLVNQPFLINLPFKKSFATELFREVIIASLIWNSLVVEKLNKNRAHQLNEFFKHLTNRLSAAKAAGEQKKIIFDPNIIKMYLAWKMEKTVKKYFLTRRQLDKYFFNCVYNILKNYPRNFFQDLKKGKGGY